MVTFEFDMTAAADEICDAALPSLKGKTELLQRNAKQSKGRN